MDVAPVNADGITSAATSLVATVSMNRGGMPDVILKVLSLAIQLLN
jgi:hypothetical protein